MYKHKKHLFFDLDHTLWDFDKNSGFAFDTIFKNHKLKISVQEFLKIYMPRNQYYWKLYQVNKISHEDLRYYRLKDVFDALKFDISEDLIHQLSEDYITYLPEYNHLFDGAIELLEYLKPNYILHIITNGFSQVQDKKLTNSNIGHYFETITNSEMAGQKKPNPIIFEYALRVANASKEDSIMIGDSFEADVLGALDFGMDAIYFNEGKIKVNHDVFQVSHLLELKNIL
ncbi:YjjG family noncanonical pyrimidine nucleotidase [uncultured Flavobacterium sp.]|mgnify:CR=1 FL=1|uniref:YjjG family noncanonical pyrimidine nucleotidase n=1 Tax=uncultured Flavobacterium sp. TaxID=165435 RepID=UPI0030CA227A|tara:strand:- start:1323 stop:2009 length:687 start_codon:yes stop_codon:yes gene_type:complete